MKEALNQHLARGVQRVGFGDIFLDDLRVYRERNLAQLGMEALFPSGCVIRANSRAIFCACVFRRLWFV